MHRFWPIVEPILTSLRPRSIVEIGAGGPTTGDLLRFAREHDAVLHVVAPAAELEPGALPEDGGDHLVRHPGSSIETLPEVAGEADVVVIEVEREQERLDGVLALLDALARPSPGGFPLCLLHGGGPGGAAAEIERFLQISSRGLACAPLPAADDVAVLSERGVVDAVVGRSGTVDGSAGDPTDEAALAERDGRIALLEAAALQRDDYIEALEAALLEQSEQLSATWGSRYWRYTEPARRLVDAYRAARQRVGARRAAAVAVPLASLDSPEVRVWEPGAGEVRWVRPPEIGVRTSWRLELRAPARVGYRVSLPPGSAFVADVAVRARTWGSSHAAVRVAIRVLDGRGQPIEETVQEIDPRRVTGHGGWTRVSASLGAGGEDCVLELAAEAVGAGAPRTLVGWRDPCVLVPAPERDVARRGPRRRRGARPLRNLRPRGAGGPTISILMPVHDPEPAFLERAIESVRGQTYSRWQLCVVDDGSSDPEVVALLRAHAGREDRIALRRHEQASGISAATNAALEMAVGDFVALLDHDDELEPDALAEVAAHLRAHPGTDIVYTDEDRVLTDGNRLGAVLKPDWSPELLRSGMYTCHLGVYRRPLVEEVGGFRSEFDGSQDFDLMLRLAERTERIGHVPKALYHWRASDASVAINPMAKPYAYDAGRRAVQEHLVRTGVGGEAQQSGLPGLYRVVPRVDPGTPVSLVLPVEDGDERTLAALGRSAEALVERTAHPEWELCCVCPDPFADGCAEALSPAGGRVRTVTVPQGTARAAMVGRAVEAAAGEHVVLLDAPCTPLDDAWLDALLAFSALDGVGAVGAKVLAPDATIEHAGVVIGGGLPLPAYRGVRGDYVGYLGTLAVPCNYAAVAGVVMTPRAVLRRLGGLTRSTPLLAEAEYCLRAGAEGLRTVFCPDAALALVDPPGSRRAPLAELADFKATWEPRMPRDPFYHPRFWQQRASFPGPAPGASGSADGPTSSRAETGAAAGPAK